MPLLSLPLLAVLASALFSSGQCASVPTEERITGGQALTAPVPYQVSYQSKIDGFHVCSGIIIDETHVVTTATCCDREGGFAQVVAGEIDLTQEDAVNEQRVDVDTVTKHEDYDSYYLSNNICVVTLRDSLDLESNPSFVTAATLPQAAGEDFTGRSANVTGWGSHAMGGDNADVIHLVTVPILQDSVCASAYGVDWMQDHMICAGADGRDACQRDSGSPLVAFNVFGDLRVVGLVSFGKDCGVDGFPGVYTELAYFLDWINDNVQ